jgi:ABC-2 type transport system permease protein
MIAAALVVVGWFPRVDWLGWALLAGVVFLGEIGPLMNLPSWVEKISPFAHTPKIPVEAMSWTPEVVLTVIAAALVAAAVVGYRRRGMPVT